MILYYHLMTKWSGLGDSMELSRMGLSQSPSPFAIYRHMHRALRGAPGTTARNRWSKYGPLDRWAGSADPPVGYLCSLLWLVVHQQLGDVMPRCLSLSLPKKLLKKLFQRF
jgi:hypothetical protein